MPEIYHSLEQPSILKRGIDKIKFDRRTGILFWAKLGAIVIGISWGMAQGVVKSALWLRGEDISRLEKRIETGESFLKTRDQELAARFRADLTQTKHDIIDEIREMERDLKLEIEKCHVNISTASSRVVSANMP